MIKILLDLISQIFIASPFLALLILIILISIGYFSRIFVENIYWKKRLRNEYEFKQSKTIKEKISFSKTPLLKAAEDLNLRLWNLSKHIDLKWHKVKKSKWKLNENYYIQSFVYRFLIFYNWILESEDSIYHLDASQADKNDELYMLYLKTLKHIVADKDIIRDLNYSDNDFENHFYKDDLKYYVKYCRNEKNEILDFSDFKDKIKKNLTSIEKVFKFISNIENDGRNPNYAIIGCLHLVLMKFLNEFGLEYQKTSNKKIIKIVKKCYFKLENKHSFVSFLKRNKIYNEMKDILSILGLNYLYRLKNRKKIDEFEI